MIVLTLTDCPSSLRGDLTRWLFEVDTNIYVGKQSARVRDKIWERVVNNSKSGRAVMVFPAKNEQGFDFRVCGATWMPIDFDGLKLMLRPHSNMARTGANKSKTGFSKASKYHAARRFAGARRPPSLPSTYLVLDIETTGLSAESDEIIEIGAIKVIEGETKEVYQALIRIMGTVPPQIEKLTGITNDALTTDGQALGDVIRGLQAFAGDMPIVSHNASFDMGFIRSACEKHSIPSVTNPCFDTLGLARKLVDDSPDYKLATLLEYFGIEQTDAHRGVSDCSATKLLYEMLRGMAGYGDGKKVNENGGDGK